MAGNIYSGQTRGMSIGNVLNLTVRAITTNPLLLIGTAFVINGLPQGLLAFFQAGGFMGMRELAEQIGTGVISPLTIIGFSLLSLLIFIPLALIGQAIMIRAAMSGANGTVATFGECIGAAMPCVLPLLGLGILTGLAIMFGLLLLVVPGIFLILMWYVAQPALVVERLGVTEAMERSAELTRDARWLILLLVIILAVIGFVIGMVFNMIGLAIGAMSGGFSPGAMTGGGVPAGLTIGLGITGALSNTITGLLAAVLPTALYVELVNWKEGGSGEKLDQVFA